MDTIEMGPLIEVKQVKQNGIDNEILDQYKKSELLDFYQDNYNYANIANRLGRAELINGDYHFYNRSYELLEQLTNEDIKRVFTDTAGEKARIKFLTNKGKSKKYLGLVIK